METPEISNYIAFIVEGTTVETRYDFEQQMKLYVGMSISEFMCHELVSFSKSTGSEWFLGTWKLSLTLSMKLILFGKAPKLNVKRISISENISNGVFSITEKTEIVLNSWPILIVEGTATVSLISNHGRIVFDLLEKQYTTNTTILKKEHVLGIEMIECHAYNSVITLEKVTFDKKNWKEMMNQVFNDDELQSETEVWKDAPAINVPTKRIFRQRSLGIGMRCANYKCDAEVFLMDIETGNCMRCGAPQLEPHFTEWEKRQKK